jgi:prophage antirepressor-like protein
MELVVSKPANTSDEVSQRKITSLRLATDIEKSGALLNFNNTPIVVLMDQNDRKLFIAKQIGDILEYSNPSRSVREICKYSELVEYSTMNDLIEAELKRDKLNYENGSSQIVVDNFINTITTIRNTKGTVVIDEQGLFELTFNSSKPVASKFKDYMFGTVLPHLQKYGTYTKGMEHLNDTQKEEVSMVSADLVNKLTEENLLLKSDNQKLEQKINLLTMPKHLPMFLIKNEFESMYPCYNLKFWCMVTYEFSKILLRKGLLRRHNKGWRLSPKGTQVFQDYATQISGSTNQPKVMYNQQMFKDFPEIREKLLDEIDILSQII